MNCLVEFLEYHTNSLSGPEWLVHRVDRCVEIGERFLFYFIYTLFRTMYSTES